VDEWDVYQTSEVASWLALLQANDPKTAGLVDDAIYALSCSGPALGRPLVDSITSSKIRNMKELRPGSSGTSEIRILFAFDPWRSAIPAARRGQGREVEPLVRRGDPPVGTAL
jgi:hypothetical protein